MTTYKLTRNKVMLMAAVMLCLVVGAGKAYAAFADKGKVLGSSFTVGSSDIKLLKNLSLGVGTENLADELPGPSIGNIGQTWTQDYGIKLFNNGSSPVSITSNSNYATANDPDDLRSNIYVEPYPWNDVNNDGQIDSTELGVSFGKKTIVKWKTEGYNLGPLESGGTKGIVLRFSTENLSSTKQGKTGSFDFEFDSIGQ